MRDHAELRWDDGHVDALLHRMKARARRRTVYRVALASAAVLVLGLGASALWPQDAVAPVVRATDAPPQASRVIHLADGSTVTPLTDDADVVVMRVSDEAIVLDLAAGGARFDVVPGLPRAFRVVAGDVEVAVVGTIFEVWREGPGARVEVLEGRVRVRWPTGRESLLTQGESFRYPSPDAPRPRVSSAAPTAPRSTASGPTASGPSAPAPSPAAPPDAAPSEARTERAALAPETREEAVREPVARRPRPRPRPRPAQVAPWMQAAERGEFEEAARLLEADDTSTEGASLDALLLASDTMRLAGHPARALVFLDRALAIADGDPRASLVAFTRGRLLLTALSRPEEAAEAFARSRALAPNGSLAMDALAREVEARAQAGDAARARARAEEYVTRYPNGLRVAAVRRWGHLDR